MGLVLWGGFCEHHPHPRPSGRALSRRAGEGSFTSDVFGDSYFGGFSGLGGAAENRLLFARCFGRYAPQDDMGFVVWGRFCKHHPHQRLSGRG